MSTLNDQGMWIVDEDTMSQAIHDVYCGIMADHTHPNDNAYSNRYWHTN